MEGNKRNKSILVIFSLLAAVLIWVIANAATEVVVEVKDVPVEFLNAETSFAEKGFMLLDGQESTIDLRLKMTRSTVFSLDTEKIRIVADLANVTSTGVQNLACRIIYPGKTSQNDVKMEAPTNLLVPIEVGELFRKQVEIRCKLNGNVADGYLAGAVRVLPETLEVRGQQVDIMQVNYAQIELDVNSATSTIVALKNYTLYDFSDQPITSSRIHPVTDTIQVTVPVMGVKEIPLTVEFVETPGARLSSIDWSLDVENITLCGDDALLNTLTEIKLDTLAIEDLRSAESRSYEIVIPEGLYNLSGIDTATLEIVSNDIMTAPFVVSAFDYENLSSAQEVSIISTSRPVTLRGSRADITALTSEDLVAVADLRTVPTTDGIYTVPASIRTSTGADVGIVGALDVTVHLETVS